MNDAPEEDNDQDILEEKSPSIQHDLQPASVPQDEDIDSQPLSTKQVSAPNSRIVLPLNLPNHLQVRRSKSRISEE